MTDPFADWLAERHSALEGARRSAALDTLLLASDFAWDELARRPELLSLLGTRPSPAARQALAPPPDDHPELADALRRYRRAESLSIVIDDVLGRDAVETTLARSTRLAEQCLAIACHAVRRELVARHGEPRDEEGRIQPLVILGLGKLGSGELNFSSDIDLIAAFPSAGETDGRRALDNEEFFGRMVQRISQLLGDTSAEGFCYRVDWRLRPFGSAGRLALSFDAMEAYYQREGRDWERFALLRARPVGGDPQAGRELLERLRPFVWRRYFDYAALEGLRELKSLVDAEVRRRDREQDLKLGPGGIREIEFRVQLESIVRGGRDPGLRTGNTLELIALLAERGILGAAEAAGLAQAYRFLRRLENRVQMLRDEQLHRLPEDPHTRERIARALGHPGFEALLATLDGHRERVTAAFERALPQSAAAATAPTAEGALWRQVAPLADQSEGPAETISDPRAADLRRLADTAAVRAMSARGRARLDRIVPLVLAECARHPQVGDGLRRWIDLLSAVAGRTSYLALLAERPALIGRVHELLLASAWLARALTESPILLDELLDARLSGELPGRDGLRRRLAAELESVEPGDVEQELERVRQFQQAARLEHALAFLDGRSDARCTVAGLADIADGVVERLLAVALRDLARQYGELPGLAADRGIAVIGYGSLGGRELNFGSDLDLVFLYDEGLQAVESTGVRGLDGQRYLARVAQRLLFLLTTQTAFGPLYEIDARLRPNGNKGMLVITAPAFARYQREEAWLWEHQALVRARFVAGDPVLGRHFGKLRQSILLATRDPDEVDREVSAMRTRWREALDRSTPESFDLKQGEGGLVDIEFAAQRAVLKLGHKGSKSKGVIPTETATLLAWLADTGALPATAASALAEAHARLLDRGLRCTLALEKRLVPRDEGEALSYRASSALPQASRGPSLTTKPRGQT
jgi:glutamate-ammonia-ligase adenylyltransferase